MILLKFLSTIRRHTSVLIFLNVTNAFIAFCFGSTYVVKLPIEILTENDNDQLKAQRSSFDLYY